MSKRHARRLALNKIGAGRPRWRKEGRALQRDLAAERAGREKADASLTAARDTILRLNEQVAELQDRLVERELTAVASPAAVPAEATQQQEAV